MGRESMYTLLYGAKKNVGDFLILDRAVKLFKHHKPNEELHLVKRWLLVDEHLEVINQSKAIILCGGPAYQRGFYPEIYPLTERLMDIKVPIIPFGLGWFSEFPEQEPDEFTFSNSSYLMIDRIHRSVPLTSTRDYYTERILKRHGWHNTIMTGCPAWYELEYIEKDFTPIQKVKKVVVTTAQNNTFHEQNMQLIGETAKLFPEAEKYCVFHRGILSDEETSKQEERDLLKLKAVAEQHGYHIVDASYNVANIEFYKECDLHVGYRVHAHIYFLSIRKPSFLLHEDGRGRGFSDALNLPFDMAAFKPNALQEFMERVEAESANQFRSFLGLEKQFQTYYKNMQTFLHSLP